MVAKQRDCAAFDGLGDTPMQRNMNDLTAAAIAVRMDAKEDGECDELIHDMQRDTFDASHRTIAVNIFDVKACG